jgi:hypothetical protein
MVTAKVAKRTKNTVELALDIRKLSKAEVDEYGEGFFRVGDDLSQSQKSQVNLDVDNSLPKQQQGNIMAGQKFSVQGILNKKEMGFDLSGKSYNAGRKLIENAGFEFKGITNTGRRKFYNPKTKMEIYYDSGGALFKGQRSHWHIVDQSGMRYNSSGRLLPKNFNNTHIKGKK